MKKAPNFYSSFCCLSIMISQLMLPAHAIESVANAYLIQGKRDFDRGDYRAAKRLFNKAAFDADRDYKDKAYVAAIYHNAGEAYQKLVEVNPDYSDIDDDVLAQEFLESKLQTFDEEKANSSKIVGADQTSLKFEDDKLTDRRAYGAASHISTRERNQWLAIHYFRLALKLKESILGPNSEEVAMSMEGLALVYEEFDTRLEEAEALMQQALRIREAFSPNSNNVAICLSGLAKVLKTEASSHDDVNVRVSLSKDAITALERSQVILRKNRLIGSYLAGMNYSDLSILKFGLKDYLGSIVAFNNAYDILSIDKSHGQEFQAFQIAHSQIADLAFAHSLESIKKCKDGPKSALLSSLRIAKKCALRAGYGDKAQQIENKIKSVEAS